MISPTERSDTMRAAGYFALASTALVCLLWLPFGFGMVGNIEEWDILSLLTRHGVFFFAGENSPLASHRLRPLTAAPNAVAYLLSPDSFFAMHLLQMGSLIIKGVAAALMGYWLLRSRLYAVLLGLLVIVLPADTMQLSFRSFHINCAVALGMAGVAGLLYAYERRELTGRGGIILALLSAVCLGIAIQIYEVALVFVPFPFLLLWARNGLRGTLRIAFAQLPVTALWSVAVAVCLGYIYTVLAHGSTYQSSVVGGQSTSVQMVKERLWVLAFTGMGRALVGGWIDAAMILMHEFRTYVYVLATGVVIAAILVVALRSGKSALPAQEAAVGQRWVSARVVAIGLVMTAIGYLPFLSSPAHMAISQRTFLFATLGAALATTGVLALLFGGCRPRAVVAAGTLLVTVGLSAQMFQFQHYQNLSDTERQVLANVVKTVPAIGPETNVVILDGSERIGSVWMLRDNMFHALTYLYGAPVNLVHTCTVPGDYWQRLDPYGRPGNCARSANGWVFTDGPAVGAPGQPVRQPQVKIEVADASAVVVKVDSGGNVDALPDQLARLKNGDDVLSRRYAKVLADRSWPLAIDQFRHQDTSDSFRWDFGRWWSLEAAVHGRGWQDSQWANDGKFKKVSIAWANMPDASLVFNLQPRDTEYLVKGRIQAVAGNTDRKAVTISINGGPKHPLEWITDNEFYTYVPAGELVKGRNEAVFHVPVDMNFYGVGIAMDWVRFTPRN
ncbi:hypothetical protein [uncultured Stenotrophomonas sp.]|uniref:hypothetical protein n=1 Tax=uncultured Stenotrophomonas sp. TaxID=165438 RepID=UPI0028D2811B|nr:hypothetical protein [uncultured Stenotrophomonas sp.]